MTSIRLKLAAIVPKTAPSAERGFHYNPTKIYYGKMDAGEELLKMRLTIK